MPERAVTIQQRRAGRPPATEWRAAHTQPWGPWRAGREWMARGACTAPGVDPNWFTVEETATGADQQIANAKAICRGCPVRLWCRIHADETGEYGVYNAETYTERVRRLRRWRRLNLEEPA
ncbi:MAG TPA: WhiB family transcriptional regulator [Streptosporangiaceae bacterium]